MVISSTTHTVATYCEAQQRGDMIVNRDYQRSDEVWSPSARSFLIETILLGYPMPKLSLYQVTDVKSKRTYHEIVDGQQRSTAIRDFYEGKLRLISTLELRDARGRVYDELSEALQGNFLHYNLTFDVFVAATPGEIRETFRRMNSFTVPLNPEEQRHARWQGRFKWFVHRMAKAYDDAFEIMGLFSRKQLVRMADTKLFAEIVDALLNGISTTSRATLDRLYETYDGEFEREEELTTLLTDACDQLMEWQDIWETAVMKPYHAYALMLAIMHTKHGVRTLEATFPHPRGVDLNSRSVLRNLTRLATVLDRPDDVPRGYRPFLAASAERTNVVDQRKTRFVWYCRALADNLP